MFTAKGERDGMRGMIEMLKRMIIISIYRLTIMSPCSFQKKNDSQPSYMHADIYISLYKMGFSCITTRINILTSN